MPHPSNRQSHILRLPVELLCMISDSLNYRYTSSLARTCRQLYDSLLPELYGRDIRNGEHNALLHGVRSKNYAAMERSFEQGMSPNCVPGYKFSSLLAIAAAEPDTEAMEWLLERGADPNFSCGWPGNTVLADCLSIGPSFTCPNGTAFRPEVVSLLLRHGAWVDHPRFVAPPYLSIGEEQPLDAVRLAILTGSRLYRSLGKEIWSITAEIVWLLLVAGAKPGSGWMADFQELAVQTLHDPSYDLISASIFGRGHEGYARYRRGGTGLRCF